MTYKSTCIGNFSHSSHCIVAEKRKVGSSVKIGKVSIIDAECDVGDFANLHSSSGIWPKIKTVANPVIHGIRKQ